MRTYFVSVLIALTFALSASADLASLSVGSRVACLLATREGASHRIRCWDHQGKVLWDQDAGHADSMAVAGSVVCWADSGRVRCHTVARYAEFVDALKLQETFGASTTLAAIFGGENYTEACVLDATGRPICRHTQLHPPSLASRFLPFTGRYRELAMGSFQTCAIGQDQRVSCRGQYIEGCERLESDIPLGLASPSEIAVGNKRDEDSAAKCLACVRDGNHLHCWGGPGKFRAELPPEPFREKRQLIVSDGIASWITAGRVTSVDTRGKATEDGFGFSSFPQAQMLAQRNGNACVANDLDLECVFENKRFRVSHGLPASPWEKRMLQSYLGRLATLVYRDKREVLLAAAKAVENVSDERSGYFVAAAVEPLLETSDSGVVRERELPYYRSQKEAWSKRLGVSGMKDFGLNAERETISLRLILTAVRQLQAPDRFADLIISVGTALAKPGDAEASAAVVRELGKLTPVFEALLRQGKSQALVLFVQSLRAFLTPEG